MMLVARMIMAKPSATRLYTQPTASPPTSRSTNCETPREPIAYALSGRWSRTDALNRRNEEVSSSDYSVRVGRPSGMRVERVARVERADLLQCLSRTHPFSRGIGPQLDPRDGQLHSLQPPKTAGFGRKSRELGHPHFGHHSGAFIVYCELRVG